MTSTLDPYRATLDSAAAQLYSLGRHPGDELPASMRLHCLLAAGHLSDAGADLVTVPVDAAEPTLRAVLADLAALPADVFAQPDVADAAEAALTALARLEDHREHLDR